jgi:hypothetical protein
MNNFKNSDQPAHPTTPVLNQFNQTIMYLGFSKKEALAMQIFVSMYNVYLDPTDLVNDELIKKCYENAERFLNYEPENTQSDIISLS